MKEKNIISCSESGRVRIWNLEEALRPTSQTASCSIQPLSDHLLVPVMSGPEHVDVLTIRADNYQIVTISKFLQPGGDSILHVMDFWNEEQSSSELPPAQEEA